MFVRRPAFFRNSPSSRLLGSYFFVSLEVGEVRSYHGHATLSWRLLLATLKGTETAVKIASTFSWHLGITEV